MLRWYAERQTWWLRMSAWCDPAPLYPEPRRDAELAVAVAFMVRAHRKLQRRAVVPDAL